MRSLLGFLVIACSIAAQAPDSPQRYAEEGERALAAHRYADAERAYEKVRSLAPAMAEVHAQLGFIYFQQHKYEQAVTALRLALKIRPGLPNVDILLASSLCELGHYNEALPGLEKGFRRSIDPALKRMSGLRLERAYTGLRQDSKAVEVAMELARLYPDDPEILYHGGRLFGNYAYLTMRKLADVAPDSVWRHQAAGEAYQSQGDYDRALIEYRKVLAADPSRLGIHFRLGRVLELRAQQANAPPGEAAREFEQELQLDATNANAAYELAELHRKSGDLDKARELFELAVKYYPDFEEAQVGLGAVMVSSGKHDQAVPHLRKAIALNPEDEVAYYRLSQAYRALGDSAGQEKALAEFRRIRNGKPGESTAKDVFSQRDVTKQEIDPGARP